VRRFVARASRPCRAILARARGPCYEVVIPALSDAVPPDLTDRSLTETGSSRIGRWHARLVQSLPARIRLFAALWIVLLGLFLALDAPHLGVNARLHWDAETSFCTTGVTPGRDVLQSQRGHIYDIVKFTHSTDPEVTTQIFNDLNSGFTHNPLENVRLYYTQVTFILSRAAFALGKRWTGSPTDAVTAFQLSAVLSMSLSVSMLLTYCTVITPAGPDLGRRLAMMALASAATVVTSPVFLSLSRQLLTETVGFLWLVPSLLCLAWTVHPRRSTAAALAGAVAAAAGLLLTIRTRYSLGPAAGLLLTLVILGAMPVAVVRERWRHYAAVAAAAVVTTGVLVAIDIAVYGPFILPWVYDETMVRSARLFFHDFDGLKTFWLMLELNTPLLLLPLLAMAALCRRPVVAAGPVPARQQVWATRYALAAFLVVGVLIFQMARQQVGYQGRHMFALSGCCTVLMLLTAGRIRWTRQSGRTFAAVCILLLGCNLVSDFWLQAATPIIGRYGIPGPSPLRRYADSHRYSGTCLRVFCAYYDWADDDRLHDPLVATGYLKQHQAAGVTPLLVTDPVGDNRTRCGLFADTFGLAEVLAMHGRFDTAAAGTVRAALAAGRPVYLYTARDRPVCSGSFRLEPLAIPQLESAAMYRVTGVGRCVYLAANSGLVTEETPDGRLTLEHGSIVRQARGNHYPIDYIAPEDRAFYTGPASIRFRADRLDPTRRYEVGFVTWDSDGALANVTVTAGDVKATLLTRLGRHPDPTIVTLPLPAMADGSSEIEFTAANGKAPVVCEIWISPIDADR
jgi:hypothetical protein